MQSNSSLRIILRSQEGPEKDLDLIELCEKRPKDVGDAALELLRQVRLHIDLQRETQLLYIEQHFQIALNQPWTGSHLLKRILDVCDAGSYTEMLESLFYKHGGAFAVVALFVATKLYPWLFELIYALPEDAQKSLAKNVSRLSSHETITWWIKVKFENCKAEPPLPISHDPPRIPRPRNRKKKRDPKGSPSSLRGETKRSSSTPQALTPKRRRTRSPASSAPPTSELRPGHSLLGGQQSTIHPMPDDQHENSMGEALESSSHAEVDQATCNILETQAPLTQEPMAEGSSAFGESVAEGGWQIPEDYFNGLPEASGAFGVAEGGWHIPEDYFNQLPELMVTPSLLTDNFELHSRV